MRARERDREVHHHDSLLEKIGNKITIKRRSQSRAFQVPNPDLFLNPDYSPGHQLLAANYHTLARDEDVGLYLIVFLC